MSYVLVGLGNPGADYENTHHNTGRIVLEYFRIAQNFPDWEFDKKLNALVSSGKIGAQKVLLGEPETFMNKSGNALKQIQDSGLRTQVKNKKKEIVNLAVIHDDLDIPFGKFKISFNKSSGGHRGVKSIIKALKTQAFVRVRVGISSVTPKGAIKKPHGEEVVNKFILARFKPVELNELKKLAKRIAEGLVCLIVDGMEKAMSQYN